MVYHLPAKEYVAYEVHPASGVEIVISPRDAGNIEQRQGVEEILSKGYRLITHCHNTKKAEVTRLSQRDKDLFMKCFEKGEILSWIEPLKVRHLAIS
jgi:hypothetical protein